MPVRKNRKIKKRKRVAGRRKKKSLLVPVIIAGIVLQTLVAAFVILVVKPYSSSTDTDKAVLQTPAPVTYEEPVLPHTAVVVEPADKKALGDNAESEGVKQPADKKPMLAIVIDDMGYQLETGKGLLDLDLELTFAFLPAGPHMKTLSKRAARRRRDILLHFPLEPADDKWNPGPGALLISMNDQTMRSRFEKNLAALPLAIGVNNHMGSRFTQNREAMKTFLELVRENDLFFLDSMTSRNSVGHFLAREMGVKTAKRHVFLDNEKKRSKIKKQLRHLLAVAEKKGWAIGIGHPYPETLEALSELSPEIKKRARLVGVSRMVH